MSSCATGLPNMAIQFLQPARLRDGAMGEEIDCTSSTELPDAQECDATSPKSRLERW